MASIDFFNQDTVLKLKDKKETSQWLKRVINNEARKLSALSYIFCSDEFLLEINREFLHHNTLTDTITFDYSDDPYVIVGEVYISVPRVRQNASRYGFTEEQELHRVMVHGLLHLIGYGDKTALEKSVMRKKEDAYLSLRNVSRGTKMAKKTVPRGTQKRK